MNTNDHGKRPRGRSDSRIHEALGLREAGHSWQQIADALGYASADAARISCAKHAALPTPTPEAAPVPIQAAWSVSVRRVTQRPTINFYES